LVGYGGVSGGDVCNGLLLVVRAQLPAFIPGEQLLPGALPTRLLPNPR
jgi:hypothetical protein